MLVSLVDIIAASAHIISVCRALLFTVKMVMQWNYGRYYWEYLNILYLKFSIIRKYYSILNRNISVLYVARIQ